MTTITVTIPNVPPQIEAVCITEKNSAGFILNDGSQWNCHHIEEIRMLQTWQIGDEVIPDYLNSCIMRTQATALFVLTNQRLGTSCRASLSRELAPSTTTPQNLTFIERNGYVLAVGLTPYFIGFIDSGITKTWNLGDQILRYKSNIPNDCVLINPSNESMAWATPISSRQATASAGACSLQ